MAKVEFTKVSPAAGQPAATAQQPAPQPQPSAPTAPIQPPTPVAPAPLTPPGTQGTPVIPPAPPSEPRVAPPSEENSSLFGATPPEMTSAGQPAAEAAEAQAKQEAKKTRRKSSKPTKAELEAQLAALQAQVAAQNAAPAPAPTPDPVLTENNLVQETQSDGTTVIKPPHWPEEVQAKAVTLNGNPTIVAVPAPQPAAPAVAAPPVAPTPQETRPAPQAANPVIELPAQAPAPAPAPAAAHPQPQFNQAPPQAAPVVAAQPPQPRGTPSAAIQALAVRHSRAESAIQKGQYDQANPFEAGNAYIGVEQLSTPRLVMVQNVGKLRATFNPGAFVLNAAYEIPQPFLFTLLGVRPPDYVEKTSQGQQGRFTRDPAEIADWGGTLSWQEWKASGETMPMFQERWTFALLIHGTEGSPEGLFSTKDPYGNSYAMAQWSLKGTMVTNVAKPHFFTNFKMGCLLGNWSKFAFVVEGSFQKEFGGGNLAVIPKVRPYAPHPPEMLQWVMGCMGGVSGDSASPDDLE